MRKEDVFPVRLTEARFILSAVKLTSHEISCQHYDWWCEKIEKNKNEVGWGSYAFPETTRREKSWILLCKVGLSHNGYPLILIESYSLQ